MLRDLMNRPFQAELVEGHHRITLHAWEYVADRNGNAANDYLTFTFKHEHGESRNNFFEKDMSIFLSHIRRQLDRQQETIDPRLFLKELIDNKTEFDCWVVFRTIPDKMDLTKTRRVRNLLFIEPAPDNTPSTPNTTEEDSELPPGV